MRVALTVCVARAITFTDDAETLVYRRETARPTNDTERVPDGKDKSTTDRLAALPPPIPITSRSKGKGVDTVPVPLAQAVAPLTHPHLVARVALKRR